MDKESKKKAKSVSKVNSSYDQYLPRSQTVSADKKTKKGSKALPEFMSFKIKEEQPKIIYKIVSSEKFDKKWQYFGKPISFDKNSKFLSREDVIHDADQFMEVIKFYEKKIADQWKLKYK